MNKIFSSGLYLVGLLTVSVHLCGASENASLRSRVGIIGGGGAGITTAWLLENDHDVTLFERRDRLGGHAETVPVSVNGKTALIEGGFEFFSEKGSPYFNRLLKLLDVKVNKQNVTYTFFRTDQDKTFVLTPFCKGRVHWESFRPSCVLNLARLYYTLSQGQKLVEEKNKNRTLQEFVEALSLPTSFKEELFYPFAASGWGVSNEEVRDFSAYDILKTMTQGMGSFSLRPPIFNEVDLGTSAYIDAEVRQLKHTSIRLSADIAEINYDGNIYSVLESDGTLSEFDALVLATSAEEAALLLKNISETLDLRSVLAGIEYYPTTIAIHGDTRLMPKKKSDWSVANVRSDGTRAALTVYHEGKSEVPIFKSWILDEDEKLPAPLYALLYYRHAKVNLAYTKAQNALEFLQGNHQLWLAGVYTHDFNSHESAIVSAIHIAQKLAPQSRRLKQLVKKTSKL